MNLWYLLLGVGCLFAFYWWFGTPSLFMAYPKFYKEFDVSGKRLPSIEVYIDKWLIEQRWSEIEQFDQRFDAWYAQCQQYLDSCNIGRAHRKQQFEFILTKISDAPFIFAFCRDRTRYWQKNYVRHSYVVSERTDTYRYTRDYLRQRYESLKEIDFECPLTDYHVKEQRSLMTRELRESIMKRDDYRCQVCGKYMPDEVGLQIDHIIPVSKGGKSIPSNLRVTCSKCNGRKGNKLDCN